MNIEGYHKGYRKGYKVSKGERVGFDYEGVYRAMLVRGEVSGIREERILEGESLLRLSSLVYNRHYCGYGDREELIQEGVLGCYKVMSEGLYDSRYRATNYLYTAVRNTMQAYVVKRRPVLLGDLGLSDGVGTELIGDKSLRESEVERFIRGLCISLGFTEGNTGGTTLSSELMGYVRCYYRDGLGLFRGIDEVEGLNLKVSEGLVREYRMLTSYIDYRLLEEYGDGWVGAGSDSVRVLEYMEGIGDLDSRLGALRRLLGDRVYVRVLHLLEGSRIQFPSRVQLGRYKKSVEIGDKVNSGRYSVERAVRVYGKTREVVEELSRRVLSVIGRKLD